MNSPFMHEAGCGAGEDAPAAPEPDAEQGRACCIARCWRAIPAPNELDLALELPAQGHAGAVRAGAAVDQRGDFLAMIIEAIATGNDSIAVRRIGLGRGLRGLLSAESRAAAATSAATPARACRARRSTSSCLFLTGGPSQVDMFDPKPALVKYAGPAAERRRPAHRAPDRRPVAVAVRVQKYGRERHRSQRDPAAPGLGDRRHVRHPLDVHVQPHAHAGARPVSTPARCCDPAVAGLVDFVRPRDGEPESARVRRADSGRRRRRITYARRLPAGGASGHAFNDAEVEPEKMIPNLRNKWLDAAAQRRQLDALQELNRGVQRSRSARTSILEGRIKSMEAAYRMQFEAMDVFDIRKEPQGDPRRSTATLLRQRLPAGAAAGGSAASATSTWTIRAGRSGTTTRTSNKESPASAARTWTRRRRR